MRVAWVRRAVVKVDAGIVAVANVACVAGAGVAALGVEARGLRMTRVACVQALVDVDAIHAISTAGDVIRQDHVGVEVAPRARAAVDPRRGLDLDRNRSTRWQRDVSRDGNELATPVVGSRRLQVVEQGDALHRPAADQNLRDDLNAAGEVCHLNVDGDARVLHPCLHRDRQRTPRGGCQRRAARQHLGFRDRRRGVPCVAAAREAAAARLCARRLGVAVVLSSRT
mmetsp:Transcript_4305/g.8749  ORF Transcript_4305/g.8749 Transcript_4305/m.8749 type:complete len:226 (+) Transcript_4305:409-1086(+)